jgi:hypothetical protein
MVNYLAAMEYVISQGILREADFGSHSNQTKPPFRATSEPFAWDAAHRQSVLIPLYGLTTEGESGASVEAE